MTLIHAEHSGNVFLRLLFFLLGPLFGQLTEKISVCKVEQKILISVRTSNYHQHSETDKNMICKICFRQYVSPDWCKT